MGVITDSDRCKVRKPDSSIRNGWEDLDIDTLNSIFSYIPSSDLFLNVSSVCCSWRLGCWDTLFWQKSVLDLSVFESAFRKINLRTWNETGHFPGSFDFLGLEKDYLMVMRLAQNLLKSIMESGGSYSESWLVSVREIRVPHNFHILDDHLVYLAQRTPAVENLHLLGSASITRRGFAEALHNWNQIKHISLGEVYFNNYYDMIEDTRYFCPGISKLEIKCPLHHLYHGIKPVIWKNLPLVKTTRTACVCSFGGLEK